MMKVCANCKNEYRKGDKYCRYCGAPMGSPSFMEESFACIYGPQPVERTHQCVTCGYIWKTDLMIDEERWCPHCGGSAPVIMEDDEYRRGSAPVSMEDDTWM